MKVEVHIDPQLTQTQVVIHAPARSPQVEQLVRMVIGLKRYFKGAWLIDLTQEVKTA